MHRTFTWRLAAALVVAGGVVLPASAHAQFGGLLKKAAKAAQEKVDPKASKGTPAGGEALTSETFTQVLTGVRAADKILVQRDRVIAARDADQATLSNLVTQNEPVRDAYNQANATVAECRDASLEQAHRALEAKVEAKAKALVNDPAAAARLQLIGEKYAKLMTEARQKNDAAALAKAQTDMEFEIVGIDLRAQLKADTAAADAKCGKLPTPPASLAREDSLRARVDAAGDSIRTYEAQALTAGAQASGLDRVRYLQLKERINTIYLQLINKSSRIAFGDEEVALVEQHRGELDALKRAL
jgi:hypothetical protein